MYVCVCVAQVMIVHQQLTALAEGKSSKKLLGVELPTEEGDPTFNPEHPNIAAASVTRKRKKSKKIKTDPMKPKKAVVPPATAKRPVSK